MAKDKYDFIGDLLELNKLTTLQKERILKLTVKELRNDSLSKEVIEERIKAIEEKIGLNTTFLAKESTSEFVKKNNSKNLHTPIDTKNFLVLFNNSNGLKYLTHRFNSDMPEYNQFINTCKIEFEKALEDYPHASNKIVRRIEEFAFAEEPKWYIRKGKEQINNDNGWTKPEFVEWYKSSAIHPIDDAKWKNIMIGPFKETIEVRAGILPKLIDDQINIAFGDKRSMFKFEINESNLKNAEFYTDVDMMQQALFHIFSQIKDIAEINFNFSISIDFINETLNGGKFKNLLITHIDSKPTKQSNDGDFAKGDLKTIQQSLWSLCNYEIIAKFPDAIAKRILLTDNFSELKEYVAKGKSIPIEEDIKGFTHILKFY